MTVGGVALYHHNRLCSFPEAMWRSWSQRTGSLVVHRTVIAIGFAVTSHYSSTILIFRMSTGDEGNMLHFRMA